MTLRTRKMKKLWILTAVFIAAMLLLVPAFAFAEGDPVKVELGTAEGYAVLAGEEITNTGPTTITGDIGLHPGSSITGYDLITHDGEVNKTNAAAAQAKTDLVTAYNDAAGRTVTDTIPTELGGTILYPGVYDSKSGTFEITGTLTLSATNPYDAFIFQMESTLITKSGSSVVLDGQATFCQVFWQVGSSATLGTDSTFVGHVLALTDITAEKGAKIEGQLLARNGTVTLDSNTIINDTCQADIDVPYSDYYGYYGYNGYDGPPLSGLGPETVKATATATAPGGIAALPATGGLALAQILYALGGVMVAVGGIMLKRKVK